MVEPTKETSIHNLGHVISDLENKMIKYSRGLGSNPSAKDLAYIKRQEQLIHTLSDIYNSVQHLTYYDLFLEIQREIDGLCDKDKEIDGVCIKIPLKENAKRYGYIEFKL